MHALTNRAPMNMATDSAEHWIATPANMISDPMKSAARLPSLSDATGVRGIACTESR